MDVRVGPVQGKFQGKIELLEANRPESCTMKVDGRGTPGFLSGTGSWSLAADGTGTVMTYSGEVEVGGKIANVGQRLLESSAKSITRQGLELLDAQIQARLAPPAPAEAAPPPPAALLDDVITPEDPGAAPPSPPAPFVTLDEAASTSAPGDPPAAPVAPSSPQAVSEAEAARSARSDVQRAARFVAREVMARCRGPRGIPLARWAAARSR